MRGNAAYGNNDTLRASRRPANPAGWFLCGTGLCYGASACGLEYARYALLTRPGALPGGVWLAWLGDWVWAVGGGLLFLTFLYFPDGRLPSPRWRPAAWLNVAWLVAQPLAIALEPGPNNNLPFVRNPVGLAGSEDLLHLLRGIVSPLAMVTLLAALGSLLARFRRARERERQQIKWFTYAVSVWGAIILLFLVIVASPHLLPGGVYAALVALQLAVIPLVPAAIGIAILRHRLYDIDLIINRTLVYAALTGTLATLYWLGVVALQRAAGWLTGQEESAVAIVASTLAIAALFQPLRRRIQSLIDRRFYRRKYDAQQTLTAFSARLRDETDLERITADLLAVVQETMQPAHTSLWLREPERKE
jgi:hypothetical protein